MAQKAKQHVGLEKFCNSFFQKILEIDRAEKYVR